MVTIVSKQLGLFSVDVLALVMDRNTKLNLQSFLKGQAMGRAARALNCARYARVTATKNHPVNYDVISPPQPL